MSPRTPPADWDRHALEVARGIASIDRAKLPGLTTQFVAILQSAIVDAMMMVAEGSLARPAVTIRAGEIQLNAAGLALTDAECETLRGIAERIRRVAEARHAEGAAC
ncbi:hypothetical protein KPB04_12095 [Burkholderia cenocepacia]|uniref:hypothetical protein n=1 Tax=Burkholderia cenocepacia TaxID=95486 RepID=UPI0028561133|nr:hypothetical protein [Burkholderia cenocepacia]MDR8102469.1 hypothetical protein [Burkholderia cenocepacia]